ncbi:hypothetical protein C8Q76DRAFT_346044 [Earliella scabrosa]|nr:hypothetical protein C8Q76DRAFT_346044 [Earliella scabrosa]
MQTLQSRPRVTSTRPRLSHAPRYPTQLARSRGSHGREPRKLAAAPASHVQRARTRFLLPAAKDAAREQEAAPRRPSLVRAQLAAFVLSHRPGKPAAPLRSPAAEHTHIDWSAPVDPLEQGALKAGGRVAPRSPRGRAEGQKAGRGVECLNRPPLWRRPRFVAAKGSS